MCHLKLTSQTCFHAIELMMCQASEPFSKKKIAFSKNKSPFQKENL